MNRVRRLAWGTGAALLLLVGTIPPALAHGRSSPALQIKGLVTGVGGGVLHVQTSGASVTFALSNGTRVTRIVTGSTADLAPGQAVQVQFASGTSTVKSIRIDATHTNHSTSSTSKPPRGQDGDRHGTGAPPPHGTPPAGKPGYAAHPPTGAEGQLVSVTDRTVSIKNDRGQTTTYQLAGNVVVTKILPGKLSDLALFETVLVCTARGDATSAVTVTILSS